MNNGYSVQYSKDDSQICIIPKYTMPYEHFSCLLDMYNNLGYRFWLPADSRGGYIFSKTKPGDKHEKENENV